jgi:ElaB/YqjD/DUF883 family membrane-anchored ribosome-binding protein
MAQAIDTGMRRRGNRAFGASEVMRDFSDLGRDMGRLAEHLGHGVQTRTQRGVKYARAQIRAHPGAAIGASLGAGLILGMLLSGRRRHRFGAGTRTHSG